MWTTHQQSELMEDCFPHHQASELLDWDDSEMAAPMGLLSLGISSGKTLSLSPNLSSP